MSIKAITVRYDDRDDEALALISELTKVSKNRLIIKAIKLLIREESRRLVSDMTSLSEKLKAYSAIDPNSEKAIATFAESEMSVDDPIEGKPITEASSIIRSVNIQLKNA